MSIVDSVGRITITFTYANPGTSPDSDPNAIYDTITYSGFGGASLITITVWWAPLRNSNGPVPTHLRTSASKGGWAPATENLEAQSTNTDFVLATMAALFPQLNSTDNGAYNDRVVTIVQLPDGRYFPECGMTITVRFPH